MYLYLYEDILSTGSVTAAIRTTIKLHEKFIDIFELHYLDERETSLSMLSILRMFSKSFVMHPPLNFNMMTHIIRYRAKLLEIVHSAKGTVNAEI